jgi:hypothetical protein
MPCSRRCDLRTRPEEVPLIRRVAPEFAEEFVAWNAAHGLCHQLAPAKTGIGAFR